MSVVDIDQALSDRKLLGAALGDTKTWRAWLAVLRAAFGLPLSDEQAKIFSEVAGERAPPTARVDELDVLVSRRAGKSRMAAAIACYLACFQQHRLAAGEQAHVLVLSPTKQQSAIIFSYALAFLQESPILRAKIKNVTAEQIELDGNVSISIHSANFKSVRGRSLIGVVADESAFWKDETSSQPDVEIYRACAPALAASRGMWVSISSPHMKSGLLYERFRQSFGHDDARTLVIQGASATFNPTLSLHTIEKALRDDPEAAESEWLGRFRSDLSTYIDRALVEAAVERNTKERQPQSRFVYQAACDVSGGQRDSFAFAISHREDDNIVLDLVREIPAPFDPAEAMNEMAGTLTRYRCRVVTGDAYAANWVVGEARRYNLSYRHSARNRSQIYLEALPLFTSRRVALLDNQRLVSQISSLERRSWRGSRDSVDHPRGAHDDVANAVCLVLVLAAESAGARSSFEAGTSRPRVVLGHQGARRFLSRRNTPARLNYDPSGPPPWRQ
jgi:hypothetical protein